MNSSDAVKALTALAHGHRLAIFRLLVAHGQKGLPAGRIGEVVGISPTNASFHLKELTQAGLLSSRRDGRFTHYVFRAEAMRDLLHFLMHDCCEGRPELCGVDLMAKSELEVDHAI